MVIIKRTVQKIHSNRDGIEKPWDKYIKRAHKTNIKAESTLANQCLMVLL